MDFNPPGWKNEENSLPKEAALGFYLQFREERKLSPSAAAATIVQLLELFIELTPFQL